MDGAGQPLQPDAVLHGVVERLREAVRRHPRRMTLQLAREYGVPEAEVVRAWAGAAAFKVFVNFSAVPPPERLELFRQLGEKFRTNPGPGVER